MQEALQRAVSGSCLHMKGDEAARQRWATAHSTQHRLQVTTWREPHLPTWMSAPRWRRHTYVYVYIYIYTWSAPHPTWMSAPTMATSISSHSRTRAGLGYLHTQVEIYGLSLGQCGATVKSQTKRQETKWLPSKPSAASQSRNQADVGRLPAQQEAAKHERSTQRKRSPADACRLGRAWEGMRGLPHASNHTTGCMQAWDTCR